MSKIPKEYIYNIEGYLYMRASDLEKLNINQKAFNKAMYGETVFMDDSGETCYFLRDVERFLRNTKFKLK